MTSPEVRVCQKRRGKNGNKRRLSRAALIRHIFLHQDDLRVLAAKYLSGQAGLSMDELAVLVKKLSQL
jgi:hypothetical protein